MYPAKVKASLRTYLKVVVRDTDVLLRRLKRIGAPAVTNGAQISSALRTDFTKARAALESTRRQVNKLDVTDAAAFANGVTAIRTSEASAFTAIRAALVAAGTRYPSPELDSAFTGASACQSLR